MMNAMLRHEVKNLVKEIRKLHKFSNDKDEHDEALGEIERECCVESTTPRRYHDARKAKK